MSKTESRSLYETVIKNNYCIGCGACASVMKSPFKIKMNDFGNVIASANLDELDHSDVKVLDLCPFSDKSKNEDEIGDLVFPKNSNKNNKLGKYLNCYAGYVLDDNFRSKGSSGGIGKWIAHKLLDTNTVDYYIQLNQNETNDPQNPLFIYKIFFKTKNVSNGSTSAYYPTSLANILQEIKKNDGRYAITGVPCFIKAIRLLALQDPIIKERILYTIGIVCGGMKSANQSKMIGWQLGVHPSDLIKIDFRGKEYGISAATTKIYQVWSRKDNLVRKKNSSEIFGADYGMGFFKPKACDFCDDVVAETADISIGDVWLPEYRFDKKGYSLIIIRNQFLYSFFKRYANEIHLEELTPAEAIKSQEGGFRHRREALSYRLEKKQINEEWAPQKRVRAGEFNIDKKRKRIYEQREIISEKSHISFLDALKKDDLNIFYKSMSHPVKKYKIYYEGRLLKRLYNKIIRRYRIILKLWK